MNTTKPAPGTDDGYSYLDPLVLQQRRYAVAVTIAVTILILVSAGAAYLMYRPVKVSNAQLVEIVQKAITSQISSQADLQFDNVQVRQRDEGYEVSGSVDAIAPGGETGRFRFTCVVRRQRDGAWAPVQWEVTRQR
jgi:hypothetical protein